MCGNKNNVLNAWSNETSTGSNGSEENKGIVDRKPATKRKHRELKAWQDAANPSGSFENGQTDAPFSSGMTS